MRISAAAYHEAGHVVAACALGYKVHYATIKPQGDARGHAKMDNPLYGRVTRRKLEDAIVIALAGPGAQRIARPRSCRWAQMDDDFAKANALALLRKDVSLDALRDRALDLVQREWAALEEMALAIWSVSSQDGRVLHAIFASLRRD